MDSSYHSTALYLAIAVIFFLLVAIWRKTRNIGFIIGILYLYLWSLHGAWIILRTYQVGQPVETGLFLKLFPVHIDATYFSTIVLYALFIVIIGSVVLLTTKSPQSFRREKCDILKGRSFVFFIISVLGFIGSLYFTRGARQFASLSDLSIYQAFGPGNNYEGRNLYTLHSLMLIVALFSSVLSIALTFSGNRAKYLTIDNRKASFFFNGIMMVILCVYTAYLGDRSKLLSAFVMGILVYLTNTRRPRTGMVTIVGVLGALSINVLQVIRGIPARDLVKAITWERFYYGFMSMLNSGEFFAAHFSLYGVIRYNVPLTGGTSFWSFVFSMFLPRALFPDRPENIYWHYVRHVGALSVQGYTIHHAAGWYLNFGIIGIVAGAVFFGWIWSKLFNYSHNSSFKKNSLIEIYKRFGFCFFTAYIPIVIRAGIEGYKSIIIGAFVVPILILWASTIRVKIIL
ncbi:MAG: hypothetical protein WCV56_05360 [Candidatus Omnitrophota bacterium]